MLSVLSRQRLYTYALVLLVLRDAKSCHAWYTPHVASLSSLTPAHADDWRAGMFRTVLLDDPLLTLLAGLATEVFLEDPLVRHK